jgi:hypothetical protein
MALKTMDTLYKRAKEMVRYVKGHQAAIYLTKQSERNHKSITLKLPSNTHWGGVVIMFDSLLEGKESLQEMAISHIKYHIWMRARFLAVWRSTLPTRALGWRCNMAIVPTYLISHLVEGTL